MGSKQSVRKDSEESNKTANKESNIIEKQANGKIKEEPKNEIRFEEDDIKAKPKEKESENGINKELMEEIQKIKEKKNLLTKYPQNIYGKFELNFFGDNIEPDCLFWVDKRKYFVYFNIYELRNLIQEKMIEIERVYPINYEDLKEPLKEYMNREQKEEYVEKFGFFDWIGLRMKFIFQKESFNEEVRTRAKKFAFMMSQINTKLENKKDKNIIMAKIDSLTLEITPYSYSILEDIHNTIEEINIKRDTEEEVKGSLELLDKEYIKLKEKIKSVDCTQQDRKILESFLANKINSKLSLIEDSPPKEGSNSYMMMRGLRSNVNSNIIQNIDYEKSRNFFFNEELELKVIKDIKSEKNYLLAGAKIKVFYDKLLKIFEDSRDHLFQFDKDEGDKTRKVTVKEKFDFIKKYMREVENLETLGNNIEKEINKKNKKIAKGELGVIENGTKGIMNVKVMNANGVFEAGNKIIDSAYEGIIDPHIEKKLLKKTKELIEHKKEETIKLIKEFDLLEKMGFIKNEDFDIESIKGILISKKIHKSGNPLLEKYSVDIIY